MSIDLSELSAAGPVLTDGAMGTQLDALGLPPGSVHELWNLDNPQAVASVHSAYAQAGSEVVLTNTFQANAIVLARHGLDKRTADINTAAVHLASQAVGLKASVFGSVGPTGKMLITAEVTETTLIKTFAQQISALARAGAAAIVLETFADPAEARCALEAAADVCDLPIVVSFSFAAGSDNDRTVMGADADQIVDQLGPLAPAAFGANCGVGPDIAVKLVQRYRKCWDGPVWIKPNAGLPQLIQGKTVFSATPAEFASYVPALVQAGADFIGGCCGSTPDHIHAAAELL